VPQSGSRHTGTVTSTPTATSGSSAFTAQVTDKNCKTATEHGTYRCGSTFVENNSMLCSTD
jgi:hypothetical protein